MNPFRRFKNLWALSKYADIRRDETGNQVLTIDAKLHVYPKGKATVVDLLAKDPFEDETE